METPTTLQVPMFSVNDLMKLEKKHIADEINNQGYAVPSKCKTKISLINFLIGITEKGNIRPITLKVALMTHSILQVRSVLFSRQYTIEDFLTLSNDNLNYIRIALTVTTSQSIMTKVTLIKAIMTKLLDYNLVVSDDIIYVKSNSFWNYIERCYINKTYVINKKLLNLWTINFPGIIVPTNPLDFAKKLANSNLIYTLEELYTLFEMTNGEHLTEIANRIGLNISINGSITFKRLIAALVEQSLLIQSDLIYARSSDFIDLMLLPNNTIDLLSRAYGYIQSEQISHYFLVLRLYVNGILEIDKNGLYHQNDDDTDGDGDDDIEGIRENVPFVRGNSTNPRGIVKETESPEILLYVKKLRRNPEQNVELVWKTPKDPNNPYCYLSPVQLNLISVERDINLMDSQVETLTSYDEIYPDWITNIISKEKMEDIIMLSENQLAYWAAYHKINISMIDGDIRYLLYALIEYSKEKRKGPTPSTVYIDPTKTVATDWKEAFRYASYGKILNVEKINSSAVENFQHTLESLVKYPLKISVELYIRLIKLGDRIFDLAMILYKDYKDLALMSKYDVLFLLSRDMLCPTSDLEAQRTRLEQLRDLPNKMWRAVKKIYQTHNILRIIRKPQTILEKIVLSLNDKSSEVPLVEIGKMGIMVPLNQDPREYLINNIHEYSGIQNRIPNLPYPNINRLNNLDVEYLSRFSDTELFSSLGCYVYYKSRGKLVKKLSKMVSLPSFFITLNPGFAVNKKTVVNEDNTNEIKLAIAYGTLLRYHCYDLDDLITSFRFTEDNHITVFIFEDPIRINNKRNTFKRKSISNLRKLLTIYMKHYTNIIEKGNKTGEDVEIANKLQTLISNIDTGLNSFTEYRVNDLKTKTAIMAMPTTQQEIIREFLIEVFYTGMYMRCWRGPGYPYPINERDTKNDFDPESLLKMRIEKVLTPILDKLGSEKCEYLLGHDRSEGTLVNLEKRDLINWEGGALLTVEYTGVDFVSTGAAFGYYYTRFIEGTQCIRMSSTQFIGTSVYYLQLLFGYNIPNTNLVGLDKIQ